MKYCKLLLMILALQLINETAYTQVVEKGFEMMELLKISEVYRQVPDISFQVHYTYTDSIKPSEILEELDGSYKIHNGKFWAMLDSVEYVQGNLYNLTIYHQDSTIAIGNRQEYRNVLQAPLMDSLFREANVQSMQVGQLDGATRILKMRFKPESSYSYYELQYDRNSYLIRKVKFYMREPSEEKPGSGTHCISIEFSNYSDAMISDEYFREDKFIFQKGKEFLTQPAFNGYQLLVNIAQ
ncbi:hypothetical protein OCK74_12180 [Chitinophagaceae bacterium LB-8]|uniref:Uncharacterized protein n=1 Tax=Paraflavisolibacter caeni TaxID=2982496 RepID=A0A9X2XVX5_9BACT|nr:hypothetical protein [Paraflavisolibacter caeni]MCU7549880.1 hypothetical protein [Paraflavisolibacter caeni]